MHAEFGEGWEKFSCLSGTWETRQPREASLSVVTAASARAQRFVLPEVTLALASVCALTCCFWGRAMAFPSLHLPNYVPVPLTGEIQAGTWRQCSGKRFFSGFQSPQFRRESRRESVGWGWTDHLWCKHMDKMSHSFPARTWTSASGPCLCPLLGSSLEWDTRTQHSVTEHRSHMQLLTLEEVRCCCWYLLSSSHLCFCLCTSSLPATHQLFPDKENHFPEQAEHTHSSGKHHPLHKDKRDCCF